MITLDLPYPPSANKLWRNVGGKTLKSGHYRAWLHEGTLAIMVARPRKILGRYHLEIRATPPDRRARDVDNIIKPLGDLLVSAGVVADDHLAKSVYAEWADEPVKGRDLRDAAGGCMSPYRDHLQRGTGRVIFSWQADLNQRLAWLYGDAWRRRTEQADDLRTWTGARRA